MVNNAVSLSIELTELVGTWDFEPPQCILEKAEPTTTKSKISCDINKVPVAPDNGIIVLETLYAVGNGSGDVVEYKCKTGYKLSGENTTTCIIDGYWTEPNITCNRTFTPTYLFFLLLHLNVVAIMCSPPKFKNMVVKGEAKNNDKYYFGNTIKFDCIEGYKVFGDGTTRCLANGRWSRMRAKCSSRLTDLSHILLLKWIWEHQSEKTSRET